jgi:DNA-binding NarL/FixJ family response regulator
MNQKENAHYAPIVAHLDRECNYSKITQRQQLFLCLCATDLTYKEIAGRMEISTKTADRYRDGLFHKLNVKSKVGLALFAVKNGMAIW